MLKINKQLLAEQDLIDIWLYSYKNWGFQQADKYIDSLENALNVLANNPNVGVDIDYIRDGYKKYQIEGHIIFYTISRTRLNLIRVLGSNMNYSQRLQNP